jgi:hypothetical protein
VFRLIEIVDLGQHQVAATLAAPPVVFDELFGKATDDARARKRMLDRKVTPISMRGHHRSLNHEFDVGFAAAALDQLLQINHGLVCTDFAGRALVAGLQPQELRNHVPYPDHACGVVIHDKTSRPQA